MWRMFQPASSLLAAPAPKRRWLRVHRRWFAIGLPLLIGSVAWWSMRGTGPTHYVTVPAASGAVTRTVTATGTVNPELTIIVGSYVSGVIQQLMCDYNTQVKIGQVCAKIDPRPYQATLDQYSGQLARDQAILDKDKADLTRYQTLAAQNSIARQQAEDQLYVVNQDEGTVELDEGLVEGAKLDLVYTDIISPVDGTVVSRNVTQGQTVASSFQTPTLFLIATDLQKMQVDTNTSESDIGEVKEGDKSTFTVDAYPQRVFQGAVTQVRQSPQTVQNVVTYDAVVGVDNHDLALMPGMTASTQIIVDQRLNVLRVPDQALRYAPGGSGAGAPENGAARVFVLRGGSPVVVPVSVGLDDGNFSEIIKGDLHPGDQVIVADESAARNRSGLPLPRL
jgi:HlyD family secretion protein